MTVASPGAFREYIEQVRAAHNIKDVVGKYVKLAANNTAACPFHKESRPSFSLNLASQYFHCFGCKASGDVFKFVELMEGKTFHQSVELLAEWAGIPAYQAFPEDRGEIEAERAVQYVTETLARYYHAALTAEARAYFMKRRGLPEEFLERFMIGWADGQGFAFVLTALGESWMPWLEQAGLVTVVPNAMSWGPRVSVYRDFFYERLVLPAFRRKVPIFLSARVLDDREPKYLNQRGQEEPLYNEDSLGPEVFVTEGQIDALSLEAWGYPTVGLIGSLRPGAVAQLQRVRRAYLCLDPDRAGVQGTLELAAALWPRGLVVRLPAGVDPNAFYLRRSKVEFEALVAAAMDPVVFAVEQVPADAPRERLSEALAPVFWLLGQVVKPLSQRMYLEDVVAPRFRLGREAIKQCWAEIELQASSRLRCPACRTPITTGKVS